MRTLLIAWLATLVMTAAPNPADAAEQSREVVHFAGLAFTGAAADAPESLPVASRILHADGLLQANTLLSRQLANTTMPHLELRMGELATLDGTGSATAMALALDREATVVEEIANQHKLLVELSAQLLFFDYRDMQVRLAYPVTVQHVDVLDHPPTPAEIEAAYRGMVHGTGPASLSGASQAALGRLSLPDSSALRMQLVRVAVAADADVPATLAALAQGGTLGHEFTKLLSSTLGMGLLPHQSGQAVGGTMAARFADGRVFTLKVPEPDYALELEVQGFRQKTLQQTAAMRQDLLGAYFRLRALEPLSGKVYLDHGFRHGATKTLPASQAQFDLDAARYETLLSGLAMFAAAAGGGDGEWLRQQQDPRTATKQARAFQELVEKCR